ncbi:amidohydrolase [Clostridiaceae bacterium HSG29]|nr:amidohydrolase [Clostridiaceae bacterium HSG29]
MKCFYNGIFINTSNFNENIEMLIVENGLIQYKGDYNINLLNKCEEKINLKGNTLIPGFNDSHMHLLGLGLSLNQIDLSKMKSIDELILKSKEFIKENKHTQILYGKGWSQENFIEKRMLTKNDLDKISKEIPIVFTRACYHILTGNSKALDLIDKSNLNIDGGEINLETGILKENGKSVLLNKLPVPSKNEIKKHLIEAAKYVRKKGITSVQSDDLCMFPQKYNDRIFDALNEIKNDFPIKIYEQSMFGDIKNFKNHFKKGYQMTNDNSHLNMGPLKILLDGSLGSKTAYLSENYLNENHNGILMYKKKELFELVEFADENNIDVAIHAIGDGAINLAIDAIKNTRNQNMRHSIIHCQITTNKLMKEIKKSNILVHIQPIFLDYDIHIVENRIGIERTKETYNYKTMDELGINIAFGSDAPVDKVSPILGIHLAVNRTDLNGYPLNGFLPEQKIDVKKALKFYTIGSAYAERMENKKGSLDIGMQADFTIIDKNILEINEKKIKTINIVDTYVNGINI